MKVNGKELNFEQPITIQKLLTNLKLPADKVVVEVNYDIVAKEQYKTRVLEDSDSVEIVGFVGGG